MDSPVKMLEIEENPCKENNHGEIRTNGDVNGSCDESMDNCSSPESTQQPNLDSANSCDSSKFSDKHKVPNSEVPDGSIDNSGDSETEDPDGDSITDADQNGTAEESADDEFPASINGTEDDISMESDGERVNSVNRSETADHSDTIEIHSDAPIEVNSDDESETGRNSSTSHEIDNEKSTDKPESIKDINESGDVTIVDNESEMKSNGRACSSPEICDLTKDKDSSCENVSDVINLDSPPKKKKKPSFDNFTPRRSTRNLNKQKSYVETDDEQAPQDADDDIEEITPEDPLADPLDSTSIKKHRSLSITTNLGGTIVVKDTKKLVEIAATSKPTPSVGKKEPTLVIIDTNSILSGRGPVPVPVPVTHKPSISSAYSVLPMALPAQGVYPPNMRATITPIPLQPKAVPTPQPLLPSLTDDMYVVEAPSFIVPYVYEKPPVKPLKEYVKQIAKEISEEEKKKESEKKENEKKENEENDKADVEMKDIEKQDETEKKDDEESEEKEPAEKKDSEKEVKEKTEEETDEKIVDKDTDKDKDTDAVTDKNKVTENESKDDTDVKTEETTAEKTKTDEKDDSKVDSSSDVIEIKSDTSVNKSNSYFDLPLGQFFFNIGFNLVQEYVQTDLLKQQKKKRSREGNAPATNMAISSLVKSLEFSKENNEPYHLELKKCDYCSFRTESSLALAHHLETPHMRNYIYRCNFCPLEVRSPHDILFHMEAEHNTRGRLERAPAFHQCPNCPFEDNQKGKLSRHMLTCAKKFKPERNLEPPHDWEPPAKIPRVQRGKQLIPSATSYQTAFAQSNKNIPIMPTRMQSPMMASRPRGRPAMLGKMPIRQGMIYRPTTTPGGGQVLVPTSYQYGGNQIYTVVGGQGLEVDALRLATSGQPAGSSGGFTIQASSSPVNKPQNKVVHQPSISITPLPRQHAAPPVSMPNAKPGEPNSGKATFVICEICDGYIKDLEQLRNHMQWIHKVKIHPKMIYNRPPLNCQKCQFRFFTDQGLERHLLGSHGLVTSSMQEAANKGKDAGRCPVCGRVYQWKLLNHVSRDHKITLKPAHLSYKCTVCTATFGMYKQFENHVYSAHSVVAKRVIDKKNSSPSPRTATDSLLKPLKINDEITIIPQPAKPKASTSSRTESR